MMLWLLKRFTVLSFFLFTFSSWADAPKAYIDMEPGVLSGAPEVVIDGKPLKQSFWSPGKYDLADAVKENPLALEFAEKNESFAHWSGFSIGLGTVGALTYLFMADQVNYTIYWSIFGVGFVSSLILQRISLAYLYKTINAYNEVPLKTSHLDFSIVPVRSGAALGININF